jgi:hypothetical protein
VEPVTLIRSWGGPVGKGGAPYTSGTSKAGTELVNDPLPLKATVLVLIMAGKTRCADYSVEFRLAGNEDADVGAHMQMGLF